MSNPLFSISEDHMNRKHLNDTGDGVTRRTFLETGVAGSAALLGGGLTALSQTAADAANASWVEKSIPQLQGLMASGKLTSRELTLGYLQRIAELNPLLHAVIETNPEAVAIAARRDGERRAGFLRGPLHGIPILVKDNIATRDTMQTTAGSLALVNSRVPGDAPIVSQLRAAGAVILGKANLSEWANFRGFAPIDFNGWSARGGKTRDPYLLSFDPCGSSSGSAAAPAANLCAAAVGTETDGSVVCPSTNSLVFGLKPTLGLLSQDGIIPIAHSQDTAGPIARTVSDLAILLGLMRTLSDLIAFNLRHCPAEMAYYGQEIFEIADSTSGDLTDPAYLIARANCVLLSRAQGIDQVLSTGIDAIVAPSYSFASTPAAVAGYPDIAIPVGLTAEGNPAGMWMYAGFLQEPKLLSFAYALEHALHPRTGPEYLGSLQPFPSDPGICVALPEKPHVFTEKAFLPVHLGTGRPFKR